MKLVVVSDWHADWKTQRVSRREEVRRAALRSVEVAREEKANAYLFAGDLCDPDDALDVVRSLAVMVEVVCGLKAAGIPSYLIPGNHCVGEDGTGTTVLHALVSLTTCFFEPTFRQLTPEVALFALPFAPTSHTYDPAAVIATYAKVAKPDVTTIVLSHLTVPGIQPGEETREMPRGRDVVLPFAEIAKIPGKVVVINGHYHRAQTFEDPNTGVLVHVPGSLVRLTHGEEEHEPSILVLEV